MNEKTGWPVQPDPAFLASTDFFFNFRLFCTIWLIPCHSSGLSMKKDEAVAGKLEITDTPTLAASVLDYRDQS
jgi:hypothetical protein